MRSVFSILLLFCCFSLFSQFTGGEGDGFASSEFELEITGLQSELNAVGFYPSYCASGSKVTIRDQYDAIFLQDLFGNEITITNFSDSYFVVNSFVVAGAYLVVFVKGDFVQKGRLIVTD